MIERLQSLRPERLPEPESKLRQRFKTKEGDK
jgi:hypothetical protein